MILDILCGVKVTAIDRTLTVAQSYYCIFTNFICHEISPYVATQNLKYLKSNI